MKERLRRWADAGLSRSPGQVFFRRRSSRRLAVLAYHAVEDVDRFEEHIRYIRRSLMPVSLEEVMAAWTGASGLPRRAVLLTFDDGHPSVLSGAAPLLREHGIPGVVFVVAGVLNTTLPFWWEEVDGLVREGGTAGDSFTSAPGLVRLLKQAPNVERLTALSELRRTAANPAPEASQLRSGDLVRIESMGIEVGNHSLTHPCFSRCRPDEVETEVRSAHNVLTDSIGHAPRAFAYPDGDWDARATPTLQELGYRLAFMFDHRLNDHAAKDPMRVSRLRIDSVASVDRLRIVASGLHPAVHRLRGGR